MQRTNLGHLFDADALGRDRVAIVDLAHEPPRSVGYGELADLIAAAARGLRRAGLARGERVAIVSANRTEYLAAYLGAMQAGLVAVPVSWRLPPELTAAVLRDCGARLVFCDAERLAACPGDLPTVVFGGDGDGAPPPPRAGAQAFSAFLDPGPFEPVVPAPDEIGMLLYTSGSSGRPKGVRLSHRSHLWVVEQRLAGQDLARHRYLIAAPLYHMNALALAKLVLAAGACMVLMPQFQASAYLRAIEAHRCTWLTAVPPMVAMMLREREQVARTDFSSVEHLRMGSAPVSPALLEAIRAVMPRVAVVNAFGSTEGGPVVFGPHPRGLPTPPLSVGHAHPAVTLRLVDADGREADEGVLQLKSPGLMSGYHERPDLPSPFTADGYYVTGDVFRRDASGFHYFVGRSDDMFVCGGENVYPSQVERIVESHPAIAQACVVAVADPVKGHKPEAYCVVREGWTTSADEVKRHCLAHAPAYMHPRVVHFVERLPLTASNKVDRAALTRRAEAAHAAEPERRPDPA